MDFTVYGSGTVYLLTSITEAAREWVDEHLSRDRQYLGEGIAVEHRYIVALVEGARRDGLVVVAP